MRRAFFQKMPRISTVWLLVAAACCGCGADFHARQIVEYNTSAGKIDIAIKGTADQLIKSHRISLHRRIKTSDDIDIDVWVLHARPPASGLHAGSTIVLLHGLTESKASFPYFGAAERLAKMGYNVILPDLRAHGRSSGRYVTYGAKEKYDVKAVVDALLADGTVREPIYVFGATLGGATAIQYAAIDPRCKGVMTMTSFKDAQSMARRRLLFISTEQFKLAMERAGQIAKFDPQQASSVSAARKLTVPLLLYHGLLDLTVPKEHSEAIYAAAAGPKKLILIAPGPEQVALVATMEDWIARRIDSLVKNGLQTTEQ